MSNVTIMAPGSDLFETSATYICDAVNCIGVHGAGIAAIFERRYPIYSQHYKLRAKAGQVRPEFPPVFKSENGKICVAVPTMYSPGEAARASLVLTSLTSLRAFLDTTAPEGAHVALPALGCGIGRLSFQTLVHLVHAVFDTDDCKHTISLYPPR